MRARRNTRGALGAVLVTALATIPVVAGVTGSATAASTPPTQAAVQQANAWGSDDLGQLGIPNAGLTETPVAIPLPTNTLFSLIAAGGTHVVALNSVNGALEAWGANAFGQLGTGTTISEQQPVGVDMPPGYTIKELAAGESHTLALDTNGDIWAWGSNQFGQLGDGTTTDSDTPVELDMSEFDLAPNASIIQIAAGGFDSMALSSTGQVYMWGANYDGQLANGTTASSDVPVPISIPGVDIGPVANACPSIPTGCPAIATGGTHSLALDTGGSIYAWGVNDSGQIGDDSNVPALTPTPVTPSTTLDFTAIAAGPFDSLGVTNVGTVYAWGNTTSVETSGSVNDDNFTPSLVFLPPDATFNYAVAGWLTNYALSNQGVPWSWGDDTLDELGTSVQPNPDTTNRVQVPPGTSAELLGSGPDAVAGFLVTGLNQTVTAPSIPNMPYGSQPFVPTFTDGDLPITLETGGPCHVQGGDIQLVGVGICTVFGIQPGTIGFNPAPEVDSTFNITPAPLTVTAQNETGYVGDIPPLTYTVSGFVNHDSAKKVLTGNAKCTTAATESSPPGTYPITCSTGTLVSANYSFSSFVAGTLTLLPASVGYLMVGSDGSVMPDVPSPSANATPLPSYGGLSGVSLDAPIVGASLEYNHDGYWLVGADGGIFSFGTAGYFGSMGGRPLNQPIVGMASTPDGQGYWLVAADGGIFSFGDAQFYGSTGGMALNRPIVGMAATPDGHGYWLVAADGGVFAFGDAGFYGSTGGYPLHTSVVAIAPSVDGNGYWIVTAAGDVYAYGDAPFEGSLGYLDLPDQIVGITSTFNGQGYTLAGNDGAAFSFGDAGWYGGQNGTAHAPIVAVI